MGRLAAVVLLALLVLLAAPPRAAALVLDPPVHGPVLAHFHAPTRFGAGHRGVDLGAAPGTLVRAAAAGRVTFAGRVVDARWVTVDHGTVRTTVGPLDEVHVGRGDHVVRGSVLGSSGRAHGRDALHWSARHGHTYVDPLAVGRLVASLVPAPAAADRLWPRARVR